MRKKRFLELKKPYLHNLEKAAHVSYHDQICTFMAEAGVGQNADVAELLARYRSCIDRQLKSLVYHRDLESTPLVSEANERCNTRYRYILGCLANSVYFFDTDSEGRAERLRKEILKRYPMRVCQAAMPLRLSKFRGLVSNLMEDWQDLVEALHLEHDLELLQQHVDEYEKAFTQRVQEKVDRPKAVSTKLRHEMDSLSHLLLLYVQAWANTPTTDKMRREFYAAMYHLLEECNAVAKEFE